MGHAILCAEKFVGDNPFAVLLGDTICTGSPNCTKALVNLFVEKSSNVFSVEEIKPEETKRYGIVSGEKLKEGLLLVDDLVEKPDSNAAPSLLGIQGRYVFTRQLFDHLKQTELGVGGEIQLTDAMRSLSKVQKMYSWTFKGKRFDIGTMEDWFQSHLELSYDSTEFSSVLEGVLKKIMRYLVTGGAGFIGSNLCRRLLSDGHSVACLDDLTTGKYKNIEELENDNRFNFFDHDLTKPFFQKI